MNLANVAQWTRRQLAQVTGSDIPVRGSLEVPRTTRVAQPIFDLFENEREFRVVMDVPGATLRNTQLAWDDFDTLSVYVQRTAPAGAPSFTECDEPDWFREIILTPEADGAKAHSTLRDGTLTIRVPKRRTSDSKLIPVFVSW